MAKDNNVVRMTGGQGAGRPALPASLVRLRDASGQSLRQILAGLFDGADDALFELADRAASNQDQNAYFDAMRELRLRRKAMVVSLLQCVSRAFNELGRPGKAEASGALEQIDSDALSLMDNEAMEQQVAIDNLANKLRNRYQDAIQLLTARFRHLMPGLSLSDKALPLGPDVLCAAVADACSDLDIDIRAKLVVLKLFDRTLTEQLAGFYRDANQILVNEGVLPEMKRPPVIGRPGAGSGSPVQRPATGEAAASQDEAAVSAGGTTQPTFNELAALLHQHTGSDNLGSAGGILLDTDRLMARLSSVQVQAARWQPGQVVSLGEQLRPVFRNEQGEALKVGQVDSDVINLVSMLFDFILEDRQLHGTMKALIGRLQIPVLKVALSDRNFFNRGGHPVRKLLNELALAAIGWSEKRAGQRDPLKEKIEEVVTRVLSEYATDVSLFETLLRDFQHFMDLDRRRRELIEQRLRDAEEGRARQEQAIEATAEVVRPLVAGHDLPESVRTLLEEPGSRYLQWLHLREGTETARWPEAVALMERLAWSVDPRPIGPDTRAELLRAIPGLVDDLRAALQEIAWDPFATDALIRDLELAHVDVFQRLLTTAPVPAAPEADPGSTVPEPMALQFPEAPAEGTVSETVEAKADEPPVAAAKSAPVAERAAPVVAEASGTAADTAPVSAAQPSPAPEWLARADALRVGSWLELSRTDTRVRCKLAAVIKATGKYIFVNRGGAKVAEYYRDDLACALAAGEVSVLDDGLIFDRALESIIDNLRSSRRD